MTDLPEGFTLDRPVAWLILRSKRDGTVESRVVMSPLTDDHYMDEGDEAWPLFLPKP